MHCNQQVGRHTGVTNEVHGWCVSRYAASCLLFAVAATASIISDSQYENCTGIVTSVADAICDIDNNIQSCEYDGGDCCPSTCNPTESADCTTDTRECLNPEAIDYPYAEFEECSGAWRYIEDGICDQDNNHVDCGYDGGDCCPSTCDNSFGHCPEDESHCIDPSAEDFGFVGYENCTGYMPNAENGRCEDENNNADCGYDGGDCCKCTCAPADFSCMSKFDCVDPTIADHDDECGQVKPCSVNALQQFVVRNTSDALELARSIRCSGGLFSVEWAGHVIVNETFWVTDQTTLSITGNGGNSTAIVDGNYTAKIFSVSNATLHLENMYLIRGQAMKGGVLSIDYGNVTLNGDNAFINNTSTSHGTIRVVNGGNLSSDGNLTLANNTGERRGGAISISESYVSLHGNTIFSENKVDTMGGMDENNFGGAIYVSGKSRLSWSGQTTFFNNSISGNSVNRTIFCYGGAVAADTGSSVSWTGRTYFIGNRATSGGGALYANSTATFTWTNETGFINNGASKGGTVLLETSSKASWSGATTFEGSTADIGGVLYITEGSTVKWTASTTFSGNKAESYGGAIYIRDSSLMESQGVTILERNIASEGGALYIGDGSTIVLNRTVSFAHNIADFQGGAVYAFGDTLATDDTYIQFNAPTTFIKNYAGTYGGALMVSGSVTCALGSNTLDFRRNVAGSTGGAVLITGVGTGPTFHGSKFVANKAEIGGALYATGTGTAISATGESYPLTFDQCNFTGNLANSSGGAVESVAGNDYFVSTYFADNVAIQGGALRLAGTASIVDCYFGRNLAAENGGPAISYVGYTEDMGSSFFVGNDFNCDPGYFLNYEEGERYPVVCLGCSECNDCTLDDNSSYPTCVEAMKHTDSSGGSVVLRTLRVDRGFWRATSTSWEILECYNQDACLGGLTDSDEFCATGYGGPYCAVCSDGYTESLSYTCRLCSGDNVTLMAWLVVPSILILALVFLGYMVAKERRTSKRDCLNHILKLPLQSIKIVIVAWQIMTELTSATNISFPKAYKIFLEVVGLVNFDIGLILSAGCFIDMDFHDRLITCTVGPIVAMSVLAFTYRIALRRNRGSEDAIQIVREKHVTMALWITFLVYSSVSSAIFQMFSCETLDGKSFLRADYSIMCDSSKHRILKIYAVFMILLYPVGIPLAYVGLLFFSREALKMSPTPDASNLRVKAALQLSSPYQPGCFYYEVVECARRVTLTGAIVLVLPYEMGQVAVTLILIVVFTVCSESLAPYRNPWDTWISRIGHMVVFLSIFVAFIVSYVDDREDGRVSEEEYGRALVVINLCWIVAVVVEGVTTVCSDIPTAEHLPQCVPISGFSEFFSRDSTALETASKVSINKGGAIERPRFRQGKAFPMPPHTHLDSVDGSA